MGNKLYKLKICFVCLIIAINTLCSGQAIQASDILFVEKQQVNSLSPRIVLTEELLKSTYFNFIPSKYFYEAKGMSIQGTLIRSKLTGKVVLILGMPRVGKSELAKLLISSPKQSYLLEDPHADWEFLRNLWC